MNPETVAIAGVTLIVLIPGLVELLKLFAPTADGRFWLLASFTFGVIGQTATWIIANENQPPQTFDEWVAIVVTGLAFGLAASKTYDEHDDPTSDSIVQAPLLRLVQR